MAKYITGVIQLLLYLNVFIVFVNAQEQPEIAKTILPEIKRTGETGYLNCTVSRQRNNKVFWIHKQTATTLTSDDKVELEDKFNAFVDGGYRKYDVERIQEGDRTTYILIIRRLQLTDAGDYTCKIQISGEQNHPAKDGQLIVLIPPAIQQTRTTQTVTQRLGLNVNLTCAATGYPKPNITWMRPNGKRMPFPYDEKFTVKGDVLQLRNLGKTDRGVYRCIADNAVRPPAMFDATLYVEFAPYALAVQTTYGQSSRGQFDVLLECRISGFPLPELKWFQITDGGEMQEITDTDRHEIHVLLNHGDTLKMSEFWYQLTITDVDANDFGEFRCQGSNDLGSSTASIILYETSECQGPYCVERTADTGSGSILTSHVLCVVIITLLSLFLSV